MASSAHIGWRVVGARFEQSAADVAGCPHGDVAEIAVLGRSNVGKSTLLNTLAGKRGLARVSRTPGRTRLLNFFLVELRDATEHTELRWVDLPGYGYASGPDSFAAMVEGYLTGREHLAAVLLVLDARRAPDDRDRWVIEFARSRSLFAHVVVTKTDKLRASERGLLRDRVARGLGISPRLVHLTSAVTGEGMSGHELVSLLATLAMGGRHPHRGDA